MGPNTGRLARGVLGGLTEGLTEYLEEPTEALILGDDIVEALKEGLNVIGPAMLMGGATSGGRNAGEIHQDEGQTYQEGAILDTGQDEGGQNLQQDPEVGGEASDGEAQVDQLYQRTRQEDTPEFKGWFRQSQVLDEGGHPKKVFHKTAADFSEFAKGKKVDMQGELLSMSGDVMYFRDNPEVSVSAHNAHDKTEGVREMPVYLKMESPLYVDEFNRKEMIRRWTDKEDYQSGDGEFPYTVNDTILKALKRSGFDGIIHEVHADEGSFFRGRLEGKRPAYTEYVVFEPEQIKSVFNRGTYDPQNPNILHQGEGAVETPDVSGMTPVTRETFTPKIQEAFALSDEEATSVSVVADARAKAWAEENDRSPDDFYTETFQQVVRGGEPSEESLKMINPKHQKKMQKVIDEGGPNAEVFQKALDIQRDVDMEPLFFKFNPTKPWFEGNAEYIKSTDPDLLCQRSEGVDTAVNYLKKTLGKRYVNDMAWELRARAKNAGLQVPCPQCYVFSARTKSGTAMQKKYVVGLGGYNGNLVRMRSKENIDKIRHDSLRHYSSTDFKAEHIPGLIAEMVEAVSMDLSTAAYTKQGDLARIFAPAGMYINLSVGRDSEVGMDMEEALELREKHPTVGLIYVGYTDAEILGALRNPNIDHVIPWHGSGRKKTDLERELGEEATDYTSEQNETVFRGKKRVKTKTPIEIQEHDGDVEKYVSLAEKRGLIKKYPGLYDLLEESGETDLYSKLVGPEYGKWKGDYPYKVGDPSKIDFSQVEKAYETRRETVTANQDDYLKIAREIIADVKRDGWEKGEVEVHYGLLTQEQGEVTGFTDFANDGRAILGGLRGSNVGTALHELAHVFRRGLTKSDMAVAEEWTGVKNGIWKRVHEEKFARGFERFSREGKTTNSEIRKVFRQFKAWLTNIYQSIKGSPLDVEMSDEVRQMFDKMLGAPRNKMWKKRVGLRRISNNP